MTLKPLPKAPPGTKTPAAAAKPRPQIKPVVKPTKTQPTPPVKKIPAASGTPTVDRSITPPSVIPKAPAVDLRTVDLPIAARLFIPPAATTPTGDVYSAKPAAPPEPKPVVTPPQARSLTPLSLALAAQAAQANQIPIETRQLYTVPLARSLPGAIPSNGVQRTAALPDPSQIAAAMAISGTIGGINIDLGDDPTPAAESSDNTGKMVLIAVVILAAVVLLRRRR